MVLSQRGVAKNTIRGFDFPMDLYDLARGFLFEFAFFFSFLDFPAAVFCLAALESLAAAAAFWAFAPPF